MKTVFVALVVSLIPITSRAASTATWTLSDLVNHVERVSPAVAAAQADVVAAESTRRQEGIYPNPVAGIEKAGDLIYRLDQHFDNPGSRQARLAIADKDLAAAQVRLDQVRLEVRSQVEEAGYRLLAARDRQQLAQANANLLSRLHKTLPDRYRPGLASAAQTLRVDLESSRTQNELRSLQADERQTQALLNAYLLLPSTAALELTGTVEDALPAVDLAQVEALALQHNTALRLAHWESSKAESTLALERKNRFVGPDAGINLDRPLGETFYLVGFQASVPLPLWNQNQGAIKVAEAHLAASRDQELVQKQTLLAEADRLYQAYVSAQERLANFHKDGLPEKAIRMRKEATQAFEQGLLNLTDYLDSLGTANQAQGDYIQSELDGQAARIALFQLMGGPQ